MYLRSFGRRYNLFWIRISTEHIFSIFPGFFLIEQKNTGTKSIPDVWKQKNE